jgi:hypothetical protein
MSLADCYAPDPFPLVYVRHHGRYPVYLVLGIKWSKRVANRFLHALKHLSLKFSLPCIGALSTHLAQCSFNHDGLKRSIQKYASSPSNGPPKNSQRIVCSFSYTCRITNRFHGGSAPSNAIVWPGWKFIVFMILCLFC